MMTYNADADGQEDVTLQPGEGAHRKSPAFPVGTGEQR